MSTARQIIADVCAALPVERVEIRRPERFVELDEPTQQIVRTAPYEYYGNDRLDVSPGSTDPIGGWFSPSKEIAKLMDCARRAQNSELTAQAWVELEKEYTAEMRVSFGLVPGTATWSAVPVAAQRDIHTALARGIEPNPAAWQALRSIREVTLVCTCTDASRCHRVLLARILEKLGANYSGEIA
jgi:hypothetical protein